MSHVLDRIIEEVHSLSPAERQQLREALDRETDSAAAASKTQPPLRALEQRWLAEHRNEYVGQWVALNGERLIVHGKDARTVYRGAREAGITSPFIVRVEPYDEPSMGGWQ